MRHVSSLDKRETIFKENMSPILPNTICYPNHHGDHSVTNLELIHQGSSNC